MYDMVIWVNVPDGGIASPCELSPQQDTVWSPPIAQVVREPKMTDVADSGSADAAAGTANANANTAGKPTPAVNTATTPNRAPRHRGWDRRTRAALTDTSPTITTTEPSLEDHPSSEDLSG
ncbi:MAG: hypothetical protein GX643_09925 [Acidimicrobiales bacterium]|nr:hypothetical protein [Acidimicrobiales bacterium]